MRSISLPEEKNKQLPPCKNKIDDANCEHWAGLGMCQSRASFMIDKCQHACNSCPKGLSVFCQSFENHQGHTQNKQDIWLRCWTVEITKYSVLALRTSAERRRKRAWILMLRTWVECKHVVALLRFPRKFSPPVFAPSASRWTIVKLRGKRNYSSLNEPILSCVPWFLCQLAYF